MENLKSFIQSYVNFSEKEWQIIQDCFVKRKIKKNERILNEGEICRHFYFLENGLIRFFYNIDGKDITKTFAIAPYCFTSKKSFREQNPSIEGIQALEESIVWQTTFTDYKNLANIENWNVFIRKILNEINDFSEKLMFETKTQTAEERYKNLLNEYPASLIQKIPLKHLSTFLGIAPQSLSRIRKKLWRPEKS